MGAERNYEQKMSRQKGEKVLKGKVMYIGGPGMMRHEEDAQRIGVEKSKEPSPGLRYV